MVANLAIWLAVWWESPNPFLTVSFLDIGQGDAILITAPNRNQILIDGGPSHQSIVRALSEAMPFYDRSIDLVIESHPDQDHIGGLPEVFERYEVAGFIEPAFKAETAIYKNLQQKVADEKAAHLFAQKGTKIILEPGIILEVLLARPWMLGPRGGKPDTNASSIVARLTYGQTTFLFTGDLPMKYENQLVYAEPDKIKADVLKVGHHGAKTSSSLYFLKTVKPEYAVISVGENNRYGHPSPQTLSNLDSVKTEVLQTKDLGTITLKSNGQTVGF